MPLPPDFLDELRSRVPVSEVVGARVRLTRAGHEFKGLCPFHKEKSPSFTVNDQKGFYHCFGCGAHGDAISFLREHDNLPFMEAVEQLAARAGLAVPQPTPEEQARFERQRGLHDLTEAACTFFQASLRKPAGRAALAYLRDRGLDDEALALFRLGYAPADGQALLSALKADGFELESMIEVGLARQPEDGRSPYAFFRNRVMFPVEDRRGRVVAFGGRILEGDGPKYINSPDHALFHKGQLLYGLARARKTAHQGHGVVVAEGYMDVIALVRAGFQAAVAPLGTALTEAQLKELWKIAKTPVLCFDGDEAGRRAAWRAADRALPMLEPDQSIRIAYLPAGEDPDTLIAGGGMAAMRSVLEAALPLSDVLWQRALMVQKTDTPEGRAGLKVALGREAARIVDPTVRDFYRSEFDSRVDAAFPQRPRRFFGQDRLAARSADRRHPAPLPTRQISDKAAVIPLLTAVVNHPALFDDIAENLGELSFGDRSLDALKSEVVTLLTNHPELGSDDLRHQLADSGHGTTLERISSQEVYGRATYVRPSKPLQEVLLKWRDTWRRLLKKRLESEARLAFEQYQRDPTDENWARAKSYQRELLEAGNDEFDAV